MCNTIGGPWSSGGEQAGAHAGTCNFPRPALISDGLKVCLNTVTQEVLISLLLSECVYQILDRGGQEEAKQSANLTYNNMSELISTPLTLQWSSSDAGHR